ncbi:exodeoxyribonuclease V subunit beta [Nitrincola nitratireducens]|uniref:RecBCD enzyme subunit RecB n=1 Tax=Nitrincola nitratireducens TaxID=1229521 RepID=W9VR34_9GAMM|nr:exodeoxyribonuclease V subunit beta [Nitrincola nitratireducens]EXJ12865.1 Exodeoxyribonuclease V beta chain [Nitrincola nitratireducens]
MSSQELEIGSFPLYGSQLIEASAGTGKTFTLALLYTRLILQQGGEAAFSQALPPEQILVVTFTDAATQELKERIRQRLVEAAECFGRTDEAADLVSSDPLIQLRSSIPKEAWLLCQRRLLIAAESMDQAAISTIHGWCYRMLKEHAFDSGSLFNQTLISDQKHLIHELVNDYWRIHFYGMDPHEAEIVKELLKSPEHLYKDIRFLIPKHDTPISFQGQAIAFEHQIRQHLTSIAQQNIQKKTAENQARLRWAESRDDLAALLRDLQPNLHKAKFGIKSEEDLLLFLSNADAWAAGQPAPKGLHYLQEGEIPLTGGKKAPAQPMHPAFAAIKTWQALESGDDSALALKAHMLAHATYWVRSELKQLLLERAELGFDDLLVQLDTALQGQQGDALRQTIKTQYPVAMIDEFQDTDPLQYRIFDRIYDIEANSPSTAIIMIGDPKQAIYSFRGADIHTYLKARYATHSRHYHLRKNYRSTQNVVSAVNTLFAQGERLSKGAFHFKELDDNPVPFLEVEAQGRPEQLQLEGEVTPAMNIWYLKGLPSTGTESNSDSNSDEESDGESPDALISIGAFREHMAKGCASQIVRWLSTPKTSGFFTQNAWTPLKPNDIAILVRSRTEADLIRTELRNRGLSSVYLSDRESVFQSSEARDLLMWLQACADPRNDRKIRAALATPTLNVNLARLEALYRDELLWEQETEHFRYFHSLWSRQGVLPMLREFMQRYELAKRVLYQNEGERILTNVLHLAEWLQQASAQFEGEQGLIRHFAEQIDDPSEEQILRLESDADLIRVITIHKSKGLEYPLVLLPFISSWKEVNHLQTSVSLSSDDSRSLEIAGSKHFPEAWEQADAERHAEDMRLLYVALTRARHALWLGIAALKSGTAKQSKMHKSALGYLLVDQETLTPGNLTQSLNALQNSDQNIRVLNAPAIESSQYTSAQTFQFRAAETSLRSPKEYWWIASYSALKTGDRQQDTDKAWLDAAPDSALEETQSEEQVPEMDQATRHLPSAEFHELHRFIRGPNAGTFLHGLLEWAAEQGFESAFQATDARRGMLEKRCQIRGWTDWVDILDHWLHSFLSTQFQLPNTSVLALHQLQRYQAEMEFMFAAHRVDTHALDTLCQTYLMPGQARPRLQPIELNGMLKGFIDLVFEFEGHYYIADWKSNYLGDQDADYALPALEKALLEKRYDVQYALYLLALHRHLRKRIPEYQYTRDVGGALYFFLRGNQHPETRGLIADRPPLAFIEALDALFRSV